MASENLTTSEGRDRLFSKIRAIRAAAQDLRAQLKALEEVAALQKQPQLSASLTSELNYAQRALSQKKLSEKLTEMGKIEEEFPHLQVHGDRTGEVRNAIEGALSRWPQSRSTDLDSIKTAIKKSSEELDKAIIGCFWLTIPVDVQRRLAKFPIGKSFDFELVYKDEIPDELVRKQILGELEQREVWGWVDLKEGLIYKISPDRKIRILTYLAPLLSAVAAVLALILVLAGLKKLDVDLSSVHLDDTKATVAAFLLVLGGAVIHLVVENVKQAQMDAVPIVAIGNLLDWMHLRWAGISRMVLPLLVIAIGMRTLVESTPDQVATYVLAGYSADSVAGLFLTRFDSSASASVKGLIERLKKAEPTQKAGLAQKGS